MLPHFGCAIFFVFILSQALPSVSAQASGEAESQLYRANLLFHQRADLNQAMAAAKLYRKVVAKDPYNEEAALRLARLLIWVGMHSTGEKEINLYHEAVEVARKAVQAHPNRPGPHYWLGMAYGLLADAMMSLKSLIYVRGLHKEMELLLELDPGYYYGGAYRVLGRLNTKLPRLFGGDRVKAEQYLRRAVELGPSYVLNHLLLAGLLQDEGRIKEAAQLIAQVRQAVPQPGLEPECNFWKGLAERFLRQHLQKNPTHGQAVETNP